MARLPRAWRVLGLAYLILVLVKVLFSLFVVSPTIFGDEYAYVKLAQSFSQEGSLRIHGVGSTSYPPLYPLVLSLAFVLKDMELVYLVMKLLNGLASSLMLVPAFLFLREFFEERWALRGAIVLGLAPWSLAITPYLMSENVFHPFFFFALYMVFRLVTRPMRYGVVMAGVAASVAIGTRYIGVALLGVFCWFIVERWVKRDRAAVRRLVGALVVCGLLVFPWVVYAWGAQDRGGVGIVAAITSTKNVGMRTLVFMPVWGAVHLVYFMLALGVLVFLANFMGWAERMRHEKSRMLLVMTIVITAVMLVLIVKRAATGSIKVVALLPDFPGRLIGRYVDMLLPLLVVNGLVGIGLKVRQRLSKGWMVVWGGVALLGSMIFYYPLVPFNNLTLALAGIVKMGLEYLVSGRLVADRVTLLTLGILLVLLLGGVWSALRMLQKQGVSIKGALMMLVFVFVATDLASLGATVYNARQWGEDEQLQLGRFLNAHRGEFDRLVIDADDCTSGVLRGNPKSLCTPQKSTTLVGFWVNKHMRIMSVENAKAGDWIVTLKVLQEQLVRETPSGIRVYRKIDLENFKQNL